MINKNLNIVIYIPADYLLIHHFVTYAETLLSYFNTCTDSAHQDPCMSTTFVLLKVKCKLLKTCNFTSACLCKLMCHI